MPTYDYICDACGHEFEAFESIKADPQTVCPECKEAKLRRKIGPGAAILFKGSGFYQTDYRSDSYKKAAKAEKSSSEGTGASNRRRHQGRFQQGEHRLVRSIVITTRFIRVFIRFDQRESLMIQGRCPTCSKTYTIDCLDDLPSFPFCTDRCRLIDLGRWIDGVYAIPGCAAGDDLRRRVRTTLKPVRRRSGRMTCRGIGVLFALPQ